MLEIYLKIISLVVFLITFLSLWLFTVNSVNASGVYTITTGIPNTPVPYKGAIFLTTDLNLNYQTGDNIWLSSQADGTGSTIVDDAIEIIVTRPNGTTARFNHSYPTYCGDLVRYFPPYNLTNLFLPGQNQVRVRLYDICGGRQFSGPIYLVNISPGPTPFLDLPWDYQGKGLSFEQIAFDPNSWFDHKYPMQNFSCCDGPITAYTGKTINKPYRSHNGYDYGWRHGVVLNTSVLAAASGWATFVSWQNSGGAGNIIKIDHENGYQTWYEHLSGTNLFINNEEGRIYVNKGQKIGEVGMTGNTTGPHIHFSVFKDTDGDGHSVTDPLGWEGVSPDPWPADKGGALSFNLFTARAQPQSASIPTTGGSLNTDQLDVSVPIGASNQQFNLVFKNGPFESISNFVTSVVPSFFLNAVNSLGQNVTQFSKPVQISYDYSDADLSNVNEDSLKLYSFNEETNEWDSIPTILDKINKIALGETLHFSQFALMGDIKDLIAPETEIIISGEKGQDNWYRSDVSVELGGRDNGGGIGLLYTLYTTNGNDWFEYQEPLVFTEEGRHTITYQSFDKAENTEERKTIEFHIDTTPPEAKIFIDPNILDLVVEGIDENLATIGETGNPATNKKDDAIYTISDLAGNTLKLDVRERDKENRDSFKIYSLQYNDSSSVIQPDNDFNVDYQTKKDKSNVKEQKFEVKREVQIRIKYDPKRNQSEITTRETGEEKLKEVKDGLILLQLKTNQGNLEYSY